jgi:hypothetical protein
MRRTASASEFAVKFADIGAWQERQHLHIERWLVFGGSGIAAKLIEATTAFRDRLRYR